MTDQGKGVTRIIAAMLANTAFIGFGLAIYGNRTGALTAGVLAAALAIIITWRAELHGGSPGMALRMQYGSNLAGSTNCGFLL